MYKKFGIDLTVYTKKDKISGFLTVLCMIALAVGTALILLKMPIISPEDSVCIPEARIYGSLTVFILFILAYGLPFTFIETRKFHLASVSIGVLFGGILFIIILFFNDFGTITNFIKLYCQNLTFGYKMSYYGDYLSNGIWQYVPLMALMFGANYLRIIMQGKGFTENEKNSGLYGSAEFADIEYLKNLKMITKSLSHLGKMSIFGKDTQNGKFLCNKICNRTVIAKPGGGKTTGVTIPALLTEDRAVFVHDPKGELWAVTAAYRIKNFKRKIITIDPFQVTYQHGFRTNNKWQNELQLAKINPLLFIPEDESKKDRFITSLVSAIVKANSSKNKSEASEHFTDTTKSIIGGLIEFVYDTKRSKTHLSESDNSRTKDKIRVLEEKITEAENLVSTSNENMKAMFLEDLKQLKDEHEKLIKNDKSIKISDTLKNIINSKTAPSLLDIHDLLNSSSKDDLLNDMSYIHKNGSQRAIQAASNILTTGDNERGSILSTARRQLQWLADSNLRKTFTSNNVDLKDFVRGDADIYIIMPEDQVNQQSRVIRMILSMVTSFLIQSNSNERATKEYLFLMDELGQLDYNPDIEAAIEILRAKKCVFWSIFQTYSQIEKYQKPDLFIDTGMLQFFSVGDPKLMEMVQKLGGKQTKLIERSNYSSSKSRQYGSVLNANSSESEGSSTYEIQSDLIHLNQVRELPKDEQYVFIDGLKPIHCKKIRYFDDPAFNNYDKNPIECA